MACLLTARRPPPLADGDGPLQRASGGGLLPSRAAAEREHVMRSFTAGPDCVLYGEPCPKWSLQSLGDVPPLPTRPAPPGTEYIVHELALIYALLFFYAMPVRGCRDAAGTARCGMRALATAMRAPDTLS